LHLSAAARAAQSWTDWKRGGLDARVLEWASANFVNFTYGLGLWLFTDVTGNAVHGSLWGAYNTVLGITHWNSDNPGISLGMSYSTFTAIFNNIVPGYVLRTLYPVPSLLESSAYGFGIHQPSAAAGNENQSHWRHAVPSKKFRTTRPAGADPHAEEPTPHSRHLRAVQL